MKILSIIAQKPGNTGSGVYLNELMKCFAAMGHEQALIAGISKEEKEEYKSYYEQFPGEVAFYPVLYGTPTLPFPVLGMSDEMPYESTRYCDLTEEMICQFQSAFCYQANRAIEEFEPDLIICHHLYLLTATILDIFPEQHVIGICHNTDLRQMQKHNLSNDYISSHMRRLEHIFVPQKAQYEQVLKLYHVKEDRISLLGMGFNQEIFKDNGIRHQDDSTPIRISYAGKIAEKKGLFSFLRALEALDEEQFPASSIEVTCAGGAGNEKEAAAIMELAAKSRFSIYFPGKLTQTELAKIYQESDIFVLPSFYEGIPLVAIEALSCGCKLLITDLPGVRDWLTSAVSNACISYVTLPEMSQVDEVAKDELPAFEERLNQGLMEIIAKPYSKADVSKLSWMAIAENILAALK